MIKNGGKMYIDKEGISHKYIWLVEEVTEWGHMPGFYYIDETEDLIGPYDSCEEAEKAFDYYVKTQLQVKS